MDGIIKRDESYHLWKFTGDEKMSSPSVYLTRCFRVFLFIKGACKWRVFFFHYFVAFFFLKAYQ